MIDGVDTVIHLAEKCIKELQPLVKEMYSGHVIIGMEKPNKQSRRKQ